MQTLGQTKLGRKESGMTHSYYLLETKNHGPQVIRKFHTKDKQVEGTKIKKNIDLIGQGGVSEILMFGKAIDSNQNYVFKKGLKGRGSQREIEKCKLLKQKCGDQLLTGHILKYRSENAKEDRETILYPLMDGDLFSLNKSELTVPQKKKLLLDICQDVKTMHDQLIVHWDLKPDNILVKKEQNGDYTGRVSDFDTIKEMPLEKQSKGKGIAIEGTYTYLPERFKKLYGMYRKLNFNEAKVSDLFAVIKIINYIGLNKGIPVLEDLVNNNYNELKEQLTINDIIDKIKSIE